MYAVALFGYAQVFLFNIGISLFASNKNTVFDDFRNVVNAAGRFASAISTGIVGCCALYCTLKYPTFDRTISDAEVNTVKFFLGYILGDLFVILVSSCVGDSSHISTYIHHIMCAFASGYCITTKDPVDLRTSIRVMLFELSTPFLNTTFILRKLNSTYESTFLCLTWVLFLVFRMVNGVVIIRELVARASIWLYFMCCFFLLNVAWFVKLTLYVIRPNRTNIKA
jgi:hypothetical protein